MLIVDGRKELLEEMTSSNQEVLGFVVQEFATLRNQTFFDDLMFGTFNAARGRIVRERIKAISRLMN